MSLQRDNSIDEVDLSDFVTPDLPGQAVRGRMEKQSSAGLDSIPEEGGIIEPLIQRTEAAIHMARAPLNAARRYSRSSSVGGEIEIQPEVCKPCGQSALTGWDCLYTTDEKLFWAPRDVVDSDTDLYRKILIRDVIDKKDVLVHEIQHVCRMNFPQRMTVICEVLHENGMSVASDDVLGEMTETPLHVALIYDATEVASVLMSHGKDELIMKKYAASECQGTTALHKAITKHNPVLLDEMLSYLDPSQKNELLHQQAKGKFFRGRVSQAGLPLSLAAVVGNAEIFDQLVQHGAQVDAVDEVTGNNVVHSLVRFSKFHKEQCLKMLEHVLQSDMVQRWWLKRRGLNNMRMTCAEYRHMKACLLKRCNHDGYTPLALSTKMNSPEICRFLMEVDDVYRFPQWRIGPTSVNYYDIAEVDSSMNGYNRPTVMDLFLYSSDIEHLDFCNLPLIKELIHRKWEAYKKLFSVFFLFHFALMTTLTYNCEWRVQALSTPNSTLPFNVMMGSVHLNPIDLIVLILSIFYVIVDVGNGLALILIFYNQWRHLAKDRKWQSFKTFIANPAVWQVDIFRVILFSFSLSYIVAISLRLTGCHGEEVAMAAALISGWSFLLCFTRAAKSIGIFTVMLQRMLLGDLIHFLLVFSVVVIAFTSAFRLLFFRLNVDTIVPQEVADLALTIFNFLRLTIGIEELDVFDRAAHPTTVKIVFIFFVILANILLLNMLIAAMSDTYAEVTHQKHNLWLKIRTKSICMIERHLPRFMRPSFGVIHRQRENDCGKLVDLYLLSVEEYAGKNSINVKNKIY